MNWFPGHMAKTRRKIEENLKLVDAVAEIIDARIPVSSRNPDINALLSQKKRFILVNKSDIADHTQTAAWIQHYKRHGIDALAIDCKSGKGLRAFVPMVKNGLRDKLAACQKKGMVGKNIRIMVVGVPNVGKSSFINKMAKANRAKVEDRPGVTRGNQWFSVSGGLELLDTPGVLWPKFEDPKTGQNLAFTGAIRDQIMDIEELAARLLEVLKEDYLSLIGARFKLLPQNLAGKSGRELLELIGRKRGMLISGGEVDLERAAVMLLDEFRGAKLGNITLEKVED